MVAKEKTATVEVQAFQAVYGIAGRTTVPDTGETKRVQIDEMSLDPALMVRAVPKREEKAYLYAKIITAKGSPLLPGQVALFRDIVFVGNGSLPLLAPEEEHELGFGVDDSIRVRYALAEEKRGETGIISTSQDRRPQLPHLRQEPARAGDATHRHRPDPGVAERRHHGGADRQERAQPARRGQQARHPGLGHEAGARRGACHRVRLPRLLASGEEGDVRAGVVKPANGEWPIANGNGEATIRHSPFAIRAGLPCYERARIADGLA